MATKFLLLCFSVPFLFLLDASIAKNTCELQGLQALQPNYQIEAEAGVTKIWDDEELWCAGVTAIETTINEKGLLLPQYDNAPKITYVIAGYGYVSVPDSSESQRIRPVRQGDIIAIPAGVVNWIYNNGNAPLVSITLFDTSNIMNENEQQLRRFFLAGDPQATSDDETNGRKRRIESNNIFTGFAEQTLKDVFGRNRDAIRKIQGKEDRRGSIVYVKNGFNITIEEEDDEGLDDHDQNHFERAKGDDFEHLGIAHPNSNQQSNNSQAERQIINNFNSSNVPILDQLKMSAERGTLYKNATLGPYWNMNANSIIYAIKGSAGLQIIGSYKYPVYDGYIKKGQIVVVPNNFAIFIQAARNSVFEWISFRTNSNAMIQEVDGRNSVFRALPVFVVENMYQISRGEAQALKRHVTRDHT